MSVAEDHIEETHPDRVRLVFRQSDGVWPFKRGIRLRPCISTGTDTPAASRNVSAKSRFETILLLVPPGLTTPGQRTRRGARSDSSKIHRLSNQPCSPR